MNTGTAIAAIVAAVVVGAVGAGWIARSNATPGDALASNNGYVGPAAAPLGDLAGPTHATQAIEIANPLGNSPQVVAEGKELFIRMNCAGCHGYGGGGGMGPKLTDSYWRYGGTPAAIYKTLYEGRPQGMPAWGRALPPATLWKLTAYVWSLGGGIAPGQAQAGLQGDHPGATDTAAQPNAAEGGNALEGQ